MALCQLIVSFQPYVPNGRCFKAPWGLFRSTSASIPTRAGAESPGSHLSQLLFSLAMPLGSGPSLSSEPGERDGLLTARTPVLD